MCQQVQLQNDVLAPTSQGWCVEGVPSAFLCGMYFMTPAMGKQPSTNKSPILVEVGALFHAHFVLW